MPLLPHVICGCLLKDMDNVRRPVPGFCLNEKMDVIFIGLSRPDCPAVLQALRPSERRQDVILYRLQKLSPEFDRENKVIAYPVFRMVHCFVSAHAVYSIFNLQ